MPWGDFGRVVFLDPDNDRARPDQPFDMTENWAGRNLAARLSVGSAVVDVDPLASRLGCQMSTMAAGQLRHWMTARSRLALRGSPAAPPRI